MSLQPAKVSLFVVLALSACHGPPAAEPPPPAFVAAPFVAHRDVRNGVPSFIWLDRNGPAYASALEAAQATLQRLAPTYRLSDAALAAVRLVAIHDTGRGPIIARFEQRVDGVEVFRGGLRLAISRAFVPLAASGLLVADVIGARQPAKIDARQAVTLAHQSLLGAAPKLSSAGSAGEYTHYDAPTLSRPARTKRVWFPVGGARLEAAHYVELVAHRGPAHGLVISARDGRVLLDFDLRHAETFSYRVYASADSLIPYDGPQGNGAVPHPTGKPDGYHPTWGDGEMVQLESFSFSRTDPWLPAGAGQTRGNNVEAYSDVVQPDRYSGGADTYGFTSSPGVFDYTYDHGAQPGGTPTNTQAAITNLFYVNNFMHDWFYDAGFDEAAGNHQRDNFGRGGSGGDPLLAEALDYSGRNNANCMVPADGASPQMQMFIFSGTSTASLDVTSPAAIAGVKNVGIAGFGTDAFDLTGTVALAIDDQGADVNDGCEPVSNDLTGKIALVHRGLCSFVQKAQNAQTAGAIGVLVINVASSADPTVPPYMGGTSTAVNVPVLSLALADGQAIEGALGDGVTVQMKRSLMIDLDGALDNSVVAHEWGHILSNRSIGNGAGLTTNQSGGLGEGWSDFVSLMLMARADDTLVPGNEDWAGVYPTGAYAASGAGADYYFGIRRVPYSVDFSKNALTFADIQDGTPLPSVPTSFGEDGSFNSEVHNTGEVWATMLWECYVGLLRDPRYSFEDAQARMKRYLVTSLQMTPVDPTLLEARDALLAVALAEDQQDFDTFWQAFARRGAGVGATGPEKDSTDNVGVSESFSADGYLQVVSAELHDDEVSCDHDDLLDVGERGSVVITLRNAGTTRLPISHVVATASSPALEFVRGGVSEVPPLGPLETIELRIGVTVQGVHEAGKVQLTIATGDVSGASPYLAEVVLPSRTHADEVAESSAIDHVDTRQTAWEPYGDNGPEWSVVEENGDGWWYIPNSYYPSDHELDSPTFTIDGTHFTLKYRHRWSFRRSQRRMVDIDGGVVELSTDGGNTWTDLSDYGTVDYNTTLDARNQVLGGRAAYGHDSDGYPDAWVESSVDVNLPEHPESVRVRFRMGTAGGFFGAPGWEIDDIELVGTTSTPFYSYVTQRDTCDPAAPIASAKAATRAHSGESIALEGAATGGNGGPLRYAWTQDSGPFARIEQSAAASTHFIAPDVTETTMVTFALRADDGKLLSAPARVTVIVDPGSGCAMGGGQPSALSIVLAALVLFFTRRRARR